MVWDDEIKNIKLGTLFLFFGKMLIAASLWYLIAMIPWVVISIIIFLGIS